MHTTTHLVLNDTDQPLTIWFEPWGANLPLPSHAQFRLDAASNQPGDLHIERRPHRVMVYAWAGCTITVFDGDQRLREYVGDFPALPPGLSMKDFVSTLFGDAPPPAEGKANQN